MKKKIYNISKVFLSVILVVTMLASCSPKAPEESAPIVVDNTNANLVSAYNTEGAYSLNIDASDEIHDISDLLFGVFFEDINFAADGGIYAEMVANRSFEFTEIAENDELFHWSAVNGATLNVEKNSENSLNENNPSYLVLTNNGDAPVGAENSGFLDGISIEKDKEYKVSFYAKAPEGYEGDVTVNLAVNGTAIATEAFSELGSEWKQYTAILTSTQTANSGVTLQVLVDKGTVWFDMISLFPVDTYKGRENGLRKDLCLLLEEMQPKFLRFPGGCVIEGYDENSAYDWKDSIGVDKNGEPVYFNGHYGDVAARSQGVSIWTDFNMTDDPYPSFFSYGLGFYEYFCLAEDIGAVGVPVVNCGLYCQGRGKGAIPIDSEQCQQYIQDMLDLVEFCRGDEGTKWGKVRVSMGHAEPFELKYICIGNENFGQDYYEHYSAFLDALNVAKSENPEIYEGVQLIYSSGLDDGTGGGDYLASYRYAQNELKEMGSTNASDFAGATDQHYYNDPQWFFQYADYYDEKNYSRTVESMVDTPYGGGLKVFLGEYASLSNTLKSALSEAAYMTGLERNGDIVEMAAYAPLFSSTVARHWAPNLIWFSNNDSTASISYYVQKLFSVNQGTAVLNHKLDGAQVDQTLKGAVGVGTWYTSAKFDNVVVKDLKTGEVLGESKCSSKKGWEFPTDGKWKIKKGALTNTTAEMNYSNSGSVAYFGDTSWTNYSFTVEATKLSGEEGFLIPFAVQDSKNNYFWNIGGWGNTVSALQCIENDMKTDKIKGTETPFTVVAGKTYTIKLEVEGSVVRGYIDGVLQFEHDCGKPAEAKAYTVVSTDDNGDIIIKLVNITEKATPVAVNIDNAEIQGDALVHQVAGTSLEDDNIHGQEEACTMKEFTLSGFSNQFNYTMPAYSVTCIRLKTK